MFFYGGCLHRMLEYNYPYCIGNMCIMWGEEHMIDYRPGRVLTINGHM
jgi:hypothetical protein